MAITKQFIDQCIEAGVEYLIIPSVIGADSKGGLYQRQFAEIEEYALSKVSSQLW